MLEDKQKKNLLDDLKTKLLSPQLRSKFGSGEITVDDIRTIADPHGRYTFQSLLRTASALSGDRSPKLRQSTFAGWQELVGDYRQKDEFKIGYLNQHDGTYPGDATPAEFVDWIEAQVEL